MISSLMNGSFLDNEPLSTIANLLHCVNINFGRIKSMTIFAVVFLCVSYPAFCLLIFVFLSGERFVRWYVRSIGKFVTFVENYIFRLLNNASWFVIFSVLDIVKNHLQHHISKAWILFLTNSQCFAAGGENGKPTFS